MLEYHKMVLHKISVVDKDLFKKEFEKAFRNLSLEDQGNLLDWWLTNSASIPVDLSALKRA